MDGDELANVFVARAKFLEKIAESKHRDEKD